MQSSRTIVRRSAGETMRSMQAASAAHEVRDGDESIETLRRHPPDSAASRGGLGGKVQCRLCGQWLNEVGSRHLKRAHGMTLAEYHRAVDQKRAADADGVLEDGTPFFGRLGEMVYDEDADKIQGRLGGDWFKWVGGLHLKFRHPGWTIDEYRRAFKLNHSQVTMAATSRQILRAIAVDRLTAGQIGSPLGDRRGLQHVPWRSLLERRPDLAAELHPTRNANLEPERVGAWSSEPAWWRCARCGRE